MKWRLVPEEATEPMQDAICWRVDRGEDEQDIYAHVLKAAPSPWVSVNERLPEDGCKVWLFLGGKVVIGAYSKWYDFIKLPCSMCEPTHWMPYEAFPLPEDE